MENFSHREDENILKTESPLSSEDPMVMEEYEIEELSVDGICGVY